MSDLVKLFSELSLSDPSVWLAAGAFLAVVMFFVIRSRRPSRYLLSGGGSNADSNFLPPTNWNSAVRRTDEKRKSVRRGGVPTPISVVDPLQARRPMDAYVLDRSTGGIRIAIQKAIPIGSTAQVRPQNCSEEVPWIPIVVRNCREIGDYFEIGCQFEKELPWNLLLLFG
ncbi:PilZ domain-containing protein [Telmatocola sphagniphila]|uniref:PilZ domain-containing protein n=1 Tax=Telmatocola sphagniphila TaxID=1123043 RepID=A0A8E6BCD9_9BACT|nr:PilZ domain-containing protein [Telmatocola sphagniphila]QVL34310.1 PilZ domain-containing protein [Telmatocola sphagniphila]